MRKRLVLALKLIAGAASLVVVALALAVARPYPADALDPDRDAPLVVTDRSGAVLRKVASRSGRREAWVALDELPSSLLLSLLAAEDQAFFEHRGVDVRSLGRAAWLDVGERRFAYGGSTLTMQLARLLRPELGRRSIAQKLVQLVDALRLERALSKREIVEQYLNRAYYGNGAVGIEAAARTYFDKPARSLSTGEATFLSVLPRGPRFYDPLRSLDQALRRRAHVLDLLEQKRLFSAEERRVAEAEPLAPMLHTPPFLAPHFVDLVLAQLPGDVRERGGTVRTTLDLPLQARLEHRVREHAASLADEGLSQAGVIVLGTQSGEVSALVGSVDFHGKEGQLDIVSTRRHPGSALKPFVYATAIETGASPAAIAADAGDVPSDHAIVRNDPRDRGPLRFREALAGSHNLAAVHVLEEVGIDRVLGRLRDAGLGPLDGDAKTYGLRLALGSATVRLIDLASAYGFLARDGRVRAARTVLYVDRARDTWRPPAPIERRVFSPQASWLTMDMLSDADARRPRFGDELPLDLPFPIAAKTGTSRGFADTVAIGVTSEWTVAAWGGNFDGKPTEGLLAMRSAAPLVRAGMLLAGRGAALTLPRAPRGIVSREVCARSGLLPGPHCSHHKVDHFRDDVPAPPPCDWHRADGVHLPAIYARWAARTRSRELDQGADR